MRTRRNTGVSIKASCTVSMMTRAARSSMGSRRALRATDLAQRPALLVLNDAEDAEVAIGGCRDHHVALAAVMRQLTGRRRVPGSEAQLSRASVAPVKNPVHQRVVLTGAHENGLAGEEVEPRQRARVRVADDGLQAALREVPDRDRAGRTASRHQRLPRARPASAHVAAQRWAGPSRRGGPDLGERASRLNVTQVHAAAVPAAA